MKKYLKQSAAAFVLATAISSYAMADDDGTAASSGSDRASGSEEVRLRAFGGSIDPFYGSINPFYGAINPFYGSISPFWGDISPFWGSISPFHGSISPFAGNIEAFHGSISPFWGDIEAFHGSISPFHGSISPFWGSISPFWGSIGPFWGDINAFWGSIESFEGEGAQDYAQLASQIEDMFGQAEAVFGEAVRYQTNLDFDRGFKNELLRRHGIDLSNPESLARLSAVDRSRFFLDFYDGLMNFSGTDRVDHWMATVNWSPALAQRAGLGDGVNVGMIDFNFSRQSDVFAHQTGMTNDIDVDHGVAVASLITAPHDFVNVMGVAPDAKLRLFNPFDHTETAGWNDLRTGVLDLAGSDIMNLSLGVTGWTLHAEWADIFRSGDFDVRKDGSVEYEFDETLFVIAAGNDGSTQIFDLDWTDVPVLDNLLIVGSVGPTGEISSFSNRPGDACLRVDDVCGAGARLMDRFLVAPGELILVLGADNTTTRLSGTSFAAPIVSGAAALVQGQWEWLEASDVANVLLWSARDLGAPGVDPVYGWGLLDIDAAMRPLNMDPLFYVGQGKREERVEDLGFRIGKLTLKAEDENHVIVFEALGDTVRDFEIPLTELILDMATSARAEQDAQKLLAERTYNDSDGPNFTDIRSFNRLVTARGDFQVHLTVAPNDPLSRVADGALPFQAGVMMQDTATGRELRFGSGEGALALSQQGGFGLFSDHRPETGGVNPVLGFASGGAYAMTGMPISEHTRLSFGVSSARDELMSVNPITGEETRLLENMADYQAYAFVADISHAVSESFSVQASYTYLNEGTGFLGAQGAGILAMEGGTSTDALTVGAEGALPFGLTVSSSATLARSREMGFDGAILSMSEAALSTAFQITARRDRVFHDRDALRVSVIQPLHVEAGALDYASSYVVDRETGELGFGSQSWELGGSRTIFGELLYATPLMQDRATVSFWGRAELSGETPMQENAGITSGARLHVQF